MTSNVRAELVSPGVYAITITRAEARNALNGDVLDGILSALTEIEKKDDSKVIILRGEGGFIAGADLGEMREMTSGQAVHYSKRGHHVTLRLEASSRILIAQVEKYALGGGFEMALACDLIVAGDGAVLGFPETGLGLIPGFGGTVRLLKRVGLERAKFLIFFGSRLKGKEAETLGLVSMAVPDAEVKKVTEEKAALLAAGATGALTTAKKLLTEFSEISGMQYKLDSEAYAFGSLFGSHDAKEGVRAFFEKRAPQFGKDL